MPQSVSDPAQAEAVAGTHLNQMRPVIVTKIQIPRRRPDLLPRRRLVNFIHSNLDRKLILISAPAGYGKTTLLTDFATDTDLPVCWYTLDSFDRDLHVFLEHLIASISSKFPAFGERSRTFLQDVSDPSRNLYPLVATFVQEIYDAIPEYFVLVLDDHHAIEEQERINEFLDLFVNYVDENCHLIIASRTLPALPNLSLLVARRQAAGLSIDELRFTPQEIQALALQNYGLELTLQQADALSQRTGGWITGLLLTATPHWEQADEHVPLRGRINVGIYDYLSQQVLDQQPAALRDFLLTSSVLDELSPALCAEVLGVEHASELMAQVRARNLFVIEFEGGSDRLRYHDLFRDFLQSTFCRRDSARFRDLTRQAALAYDRRGEWSQAVSRYLALEEYEPVARIIERRGAELMDAGRRETLASWIDALPEASLAEHPRILVQRGNIHADRGEHASALTLLDQASQIYSAEDNRPWAAYTLAQKSIVLRYQGHYAEAITYCLEALELVEETTERERFTMALALRNIGLCHVRQGQLAEGIEVLKQALALYEDLDNPYDVGMIHHDLGLVHELAGDLLGSANHYQSALEHWRTLGNPGPWANTLNGLGVVYHLQGKYDEALHTLNEALNRTRRAGDSRVEAYVWTSLGDLHRDLGAYEEAQRAYAQGFEVAKRTGVSFVLTYALDGSGNTFRLQGDLALASNRLQEAQEYAEKHHSNYESGLCHTSLGILAFEEGDTASAQQHLDRAIDLFETGGFKRELAKAHLFRAQVLFVNEKQKASLVELKQSLALTAQLGSDQILVVEGQRLLPLLRYATGQELGDGAMVQLLERIRAHQVHSVERVEVEVEPEPQSALKIYALGRIQVELNGVQAQWTTRQSRDLFYFLFQHAQGLRKDEVGSIFWPDHEPHRLDGIFRSTLYRLRRTLFRESVVFENGRYCFNRDSDYWSDVGTFERLLDQVEQETAKEQKVVFLEDALRLYQGDYLEDVYADWCALERERLQGRYLAALETLANLCTDQGYVQRAIELHQRLLEQDPYQEAAYQGLMRCYLYLGDRAAAIRQYQICAETLRQDLGLRPMPETEALYLQVIG